MNWIDGHLDLAYLAVNGRDLTRENIDAEAGCVTLPALRAGNVTLAFATIFTEPCEGDPAKPEQYRRDDADSANAAGLRQLAVYERLHAAGEINLIYASQAGPKRSAGPGPCDADQRSEAKAALRCLLLMEGADPIRSPEDVGFWHSRGVRIVGLTWATGTRYAGGNASEPGAGPLTSLGRELIEALDAHTIVHDASHLSDAAFDDLLGCARGPIVASHSNCRALVEPTQRHLRDDHIRAIGDRDGIVGLNLCSPFLATGRRATVADCVAHLEHVAEIMGHRRGVALGSDMDGGFAPQHLPIGLDHPTKLPTLVDALHDAGWSDGEIHGFAHGNWERFLKDVQCTEA